ncbi:unnamed protein product [Malus baccata var. baccata]
MDLYYGTGVDDFVVPNDGQSDRLPSPDSWSRWGISPSECFQSTNKCFSMYPQFNRELNFSGNSLSGEAVMETSVNEKDLSSSSSACEGLSEASLQQTSLSYNRACNQLEDLAGLDQMDDIFLSSLLDDLPGSENAHKSFYFCSDSNGMLPTDSISTSMSLESPSISSSVHSAGNSMYLQTHALSPTVGSDKGDVTTSQFIQCNSEHKDCLPLKTAESSMIGLGGEESSVEESVLHELEMVMKQLNEKTRICFRDSLYRLANNSKENHATQSQDGDEAMENENASSWTAQDETVRPGSKKRMESETNTIDRAVANLMFNEMDFNAQDLSGGASLDSKQEVFGATEQQTDSTCRPQISHSHIHSLLPQDAEVPTLGEGDMDVVTDDQMHSSLPSCNAHGKRKAPMREFESTTGF